MRRVNNVARFLALLMAFAMCFAVLSTATLPLAVALLGSTSADVVLLAFIMTLAVFLMARTCLKGRPFMASIARAGPASASDAINNDQFKVKGQRRLWARPYPVGFRSCRLTTKHGTSENMTTNNSRIDEMLTGVNAIVEPAEGMTRNPVGLLAERAITQLRMWMKRRYHDSVFGTSAYGVVA